MPGEGTQALGFVSAPVPGWAGAAASPERPGPAGAARDPEGLIRAGHRTASCFSRGTSCAVRSCRMSTGAKTASRIPSRDLDLSGLPVEERGEAWRQAFRGQWEMPDLPRVLEVQGRAFDLGCAMLVDTLHPSLAFARSKAQTRRDGADNIYVLTQVSGAYELATEQGEDSIGPGGATLVDISRPVSRRASDGRTLCLSVSRELVEEALPHFDLHALRVGPGGALLAEHLRSLRTHLPTVERSAAPHLVRATVTMVAACVSPTADRLEQARPTLKDAVLTRAKRHVRAHHHDPALTPERVAAAIGASRTSLYRAFEPEGGVAAFIRSARLDAARRALQDPADGRRIGEIAFAHGFGSEAHFSRAMRAAFGATPRDLRWCASQA